jgi:hypothetical protein
MNTRDLIKSTNGKNLTVIFTKKDGSTRKMNARLGVRQGVKGTGLKFNPVDHGLMTVFDMKKHAHRMVNLETVESFRCGHTNINWSK